QVTPAMVAEMRTHRGVIPLSTPQGLESFYRAFASRRPQVVVVAGEKQRLRDALLRGEDKKPSNHSSSEEGDPQIDLSNQSFDVASQPSGQPSGSLENLKFKATAYFKKLLAAVAKVPVDRVEADVPLESYGIDSVMVLQLTSELEKSFGSLSKTLLYEYQTIE